MNRRFFTDEKDERVFIVGAWKEKNMIIESRGIINITRPQLISEISPKKKNNIGKPFTNWTR